jgi:ribulose-5-phosphate 4-epimerase/fuculose-1-phosphate aldolase
VYDISDYYNSEDIQDMLVRNTHLGAGLASLFSESADDSSKTPDHAVVLMRGHGLTVVAPNIQECVLRAVYTQKNASIQTTALTTRAAHFGTSSALPVKYLSATEAAASADMTGWSAMRPWGLWVREVEAAGLYVNLA